MLWTDPAKLDIKTVSQVLCATNIGLDYVCISEVRQHVVFLPKFQTPERISVCPYGIPGGMANAGKANDIGIGIQVVSYSLIKLQETKSAKVSANRGYVSSTYLHGEFVECSVRRRGIDIHVDSDDFQ